MGNLGQAQIRLNDSMNRLKLVDYPDSTPDTVYDYGDNGNLTDLDQRWERNLGQARVM